jgi:hypothetical protein
MTGSHPADPAPRATPAASGAERSSEELREELDTLRAELGDTVEELAHRVDVPARVRAKREETTARVQEQVTQARTVIAEKAPTVETALRDRPALVAGIALVLSYLLVSRLRRRKARRRRKKAAGVVTGLADIGKDGNGTR